jgi:hypothetical protein
MARTWLSIRVELVSGHGAEFWPRPGRVFAAARSHSFGQLAEAIDVSFARPGDGAPVDHAPYDEVFPPRPSNLCSYCDFARHCPEGLQAAPRKEPWAALPTD